MTVWQLLDILWKILDPDMKDMKVYLALFQLFYFYDSNIVSYEWDVSLKILRMIKGESFLESYFEKLDLADEVFSR